MNKQFVTYEIAKQLKELGFDEPCLGFYWSDNSDFCSVYTKHQDYHKGFDLKSISAPLWQQVIDWLREGNHDIVVTIFIKSSGWSFLLQSNNGVIDKDVPPRYLTFKTYEEVREQAILKALSLINKPHKP